MQLQSSNYQNNIRVDEICQQMSALYKNPQDYHKLLEFFSLEKFERSQVNKLSGGERQKLSVALALINYPEIVFWMSSQPDLIQRPEEMSGDG